MQVRGAGRLPGPFSFPGPLLLLPGQTMSLPKGVKELRELSTLAFGIERFFRGLQFLGPQQLLATRQGIHKQQEGIEQAELWALTVQTARRRDLYIGIWLCAECVLTCIAWAAGNPRGGALWFVPVLAGLRVVDIMQTSVNIAVFDQIRVTGVHRVASLVRTLVLTAINFLELIVCFALIYWSGLGALTFQQVPATRFTEALYFSAITQLTIGYGDITPGGWLRGVAVSQGLAAYFFTLLMVGRVVSLLPRLREVVDGHS